jgi:hypothetical protein
VQDTTLEACNESGAALAQTRRDPTRVGFFLLAFRLGVVGDAVLRALRARVGAFERGEICGLL